MPALDAQIGPRVPGGGAGIGIERTTTKPNVGIYRSALSIRWHILRNLPQRFMTSPSHLTDQLARREFLSSLEANIAALASLPRETLATPRVITVSAEWGNGKTWVATELMARLRAEKDRRAALIDVFRYDHHDDAFSVIASAIYQELRPHAAAKRKFLKAAGAVLKSAAPVATKAALTVGMRALGISAEDKDLFVKQVSDVATEQAGKLSESAVESLFASYAKVQRVQEEFIDSLGALTCDLDKPMVVLIDELDRCRPSFALEVLERVKHIFSAENIVFVLFCNPASLRESIKHTYGAGTDAEKYLSKFVAFDLPLNTRAADQSGRVYREFVKALMDAHAGPKLNDEFRDGLMSAAVVLQPSLRDLQKTVQTWAQTQWFRHDHWPDISAYLLLLRSMSPARFDALLRRDAAGALAERRLFDERIQYQGGELMLMAHALTAYIAEEPRFLAIKQALRSGTATREGVDPLDVKILDRLDDGMVSAFDHHLRRMAVPPPL